MTERALASPQDLVNAIAAARSNLTWDAAAYGDTEETRGPADMSLELLVRLVWLVHDASFETEETRQTALSLYVPAAGAPAPEFVLEFDEPLELTVELVRRLAPIVPDRPMALVVGHHGGVAVARGVARVEWWGADTASPAMWRQFRRAPGLHLRVRGYGELLATEGYAAFRLRAGALESQVDFRGAGPVDDWFAEVSKSAAPDGGPDRQLVASRLLWEVWSHVIGVVLRARSGGALIVLPEEHANLNEDPSLPDQLRLSRQVRDPDLMTPVRELLNGDGSQDLSRLQQRVADRAQAVGMLATVDGAVVVTRDLHVVAYGAKILTPLSAADVPWRRYVGGEGWVDFDSSSLGTRHKSAASLCVSRPGTLVFVISQDGAVRLMTSTGDGLACRGPFALQETIAAST